MICFLHILGSIILLGVIVWLVSKLEPEQFLIYDTVYLTKDKVTDRGILLKSGTKATIIEQLSSNNFLLEISILDESLVGNHDYDTVEISRDEITKIAKIT